MRQHRCEHSLAVQGRTVSFKNTIEVMTSNMGSQDILAAMQTDPDSVKARVMSQARQPQPGTPPIAWSRYMWVT